MFKIKMKNILYIIFVFVMLIKTKISQFLTSTVPGPGPFQTTTFSTNTTPNNISQAMPPLILKLGMLIPFQKSAETRFENSASAVVIAINRIMKEKLLPQASNISIIWKFEECFEISAIGYAFDLIVKNNIDALIATPCIQSAIIVAHVGTFYNIPILLWGPTFDSSFRNQILFPTVLSVVPNFFDLGTVMCSVLNFFNWDIFSLIYQTENDGLCNSFQQDMETVANSKRSCSIAYKKLVDFTNIEDVQYILTEIKARSRIVILCFDNKSTLRRFALEIFDAGMSSNDFVYLLPDIKIKTENTALGLREEPFWLDTINLNDTRDMDAWKVANHSFFIYVDTFSSAVVSYDNFSNDVISKMHDWPFYCNECNSNKSSLYASTLYDAVYAYGLSVSKAINKANSSDISVYRDSAQLFNNSLQFKGMSGTVIIDELGLQTAIYMLSVFSNKVGLLVPFVKFEIGANSKCRNGIWFNNRSNAEIWASRAGIKPLAIPICGFDGNQCPDYKVYIIGGIVLFFFIIVAVILGIFYVVRLRLDENKRQNRLWQIPSSSLQKPVYRNKELESVRSLQSGLSGGPSTTSTKFTYDSIKSSKYGMVYVLGGERVVVIVISNNVRLDVKDMLELRAMRLLDNNNVNKFLGLTIDGAQTMSVWRYCSRGPLSGLRFIHSSPILWHGNLTTFNSLIDDRWQVKLSDYGIKFSRFAKKNSNELVWTAPEHLRENDYTGSKSGDVFSFAMVCSEVINMKPILESFDVKGSFDVLEIVYMLKKGGQELFRPLLKPIAHDLSPALLCLIRDCWSENPLERPKMETVKTLLQSMNTGKSTNLINHVLTMLEQYAGSLEEEVEERTKELVEEKKKSDILLYRMLPRQVAEKLKLGQSVEPESYENVTVFFSDVVSFTTLASKCTPLQVVNLLNNLYTVFDSIVAEYDVYKVETIGDGYLCVSGLPHRNGDEHVRQIALMSLGFMRNVGTLIIPHLPTERLRLRIGLHTGPCVAGVVGLSMPRYCLFGDTVNTASRMESNSKPMRIHVSGSTNHYLVNVIQGFVTEPRGEVIIKGKGVMETFWLLGLENDPNFQKSNANKLEYAD